MAEKSKSPSKSTRARKPARRTPRKAAPRSRGIAAKDCRLESLPETGAEAAERIEQGGGSVVGYYREPLGGKPMLLAVLPIDRIEPTPFQRDLSQAHHKRLADVIHKTGLFLDPVITYLRSFVVARINPLRWIQGEPPPLDQVLKTMRDRAARFNVTRIRQEDLSRMGGAPDEDA